MRRKFGEDRKKRTKQIKWLMTNGRPRAAVNLDNFSNTTKIGALHALCMVLKQKL